MTKADLDNWFTYHAPTPAQVEAYASLRASAHKFAGAILFYVPEGVEKDRAIAALREAVMWANSGIACRDR